MHSHSIETASARQSRSLVDDAPIVEPRHVSRVWAHPIEPRSELNPYKADDIRAEAFDYAAAMLDRMCRHYGGVMRAKWKFTRTWDRRLVIEKRRRDAWEDGWQPGQSVAALCTDWAIPFALNEGMPRQLRGWLQVYVRDVFEAIANQDRRARLNVGRRVRRWDD